MIPIGKFSSAFNPSLDVPESTQGAAGGVTALLQLLP